LVYFYNSTCFGRSSRPSSGVIFLQTVVAATGVCHLYGVDEFHVRVIGSVCDLPWFCRCWWASDVVCEWWWVVVAVSLCLESVSGHICKRVASLDVVWVGCVAVLFLFTLSVWFCVALCC